MLRDEQEDFTLVDEPDEESLFTSDYLPDLATAFAEWSRNPPRNPLITPEDVLRVVRLGIPTMRMDNIVPGEIFLTFGIETEKDLRDFSDLEG